MAKKYKVGFKTINAKLTVTKRHLQKIKKYVTAKDRKAIAAQIEAIDVILNSCGRGNPRMSAFFNAK